VATTPPAVASARWLECVERVWEREWRCLK